MSIVPSWDFDGGALGCVTEVTADRVVASIYRDWDTARFSTQATWHYARFDGVGGRPFEVVLTGLGSRYNGRWSAGGIGSRCQPFISDDGVTWRKGSGATFDEAARTYTIPLQPVGDSIWIAHLEPYVQADHDRLAGEIRGHREVRMESAGESIEGRDIPLWTVGDDAAEHCVWLMARQHPWETHTSFCLEGTVRWLLRDEAAAFRSRCVVKLLPWMNPDGVARGGSRFNAVGWDVNRHWHETDPSNDQHRRVRPEICCAKRLAIDWLAAGRPIDVYLNLHDTQDDIFVLPGPLGDNPLLRALYDDLCGCGFAGRWRANDGGDPGVIQTALHTELGIVGALIELGTTELSPLGRAPTKDDRLTFGADLGRALAGVIGA